MWKSKMNPAGGGGGQRSGFYNFFLKEGLYLMCRTKVGRTHEKLFPKKSVALTGSERCASLNVCGSLCSTWSMF